MLNRPEADRRNRNINGNEQREHLEIVLHDLVSASPGKPIVLSDEPITRQQQQNFGERTTRLASAAGVLLAQIKDPTVRRSKPANSQAENLPEPLHFALEQQTFVLDPAKPTSMTPKVSGGKGPLQFSPSFEIPGVDVDKATGKITFDPAQLREHGVELFMNQFQNNYQFQRDPVTQQPLTPDKGLGDAH